METIEQVLEGWKASRFPSIRVGSLMARNPVAYKWKGPFRAWLLREAALWRMHDVLSQSYSLHQMGHGLGARILLRSGIETLAVLIHVNQLMQEVIDGNLNFHTFSDKTTRFFGSQRQSNLPRSIRIGRVLGKCEKRYPFLKAVYSDLSESVHPSFESLCMGYLRFDHSEFEMTFSNRWMELHGEHHLNSMELCIVIFNHEYDAVWTELIVKLESWVEANDGELEATRDDPLPNG